MNQDAIGLAIAMVVPAAIDTGLYVSLCSFQAPDGLFTPAGAPSTNYVNVSGLQNIPCQSSVPSTARIQATTARDMQEIASSEFHHVDLNGYYPAIDEGWRGDGTPQGQWQIIVGDNDGSGNLINGFAYMIVGVEADSQNQYTRVQIKLGTL